MGYWQCEGCKEFGIRPKRERKWWQIWKFETCWDCGGDGRMKPPGWNEKSIKECDMIEESIGLLGRNAKDKVTDYEGIIESVAFDLYGCVHVALKRGGFDKEGNPLAGHWFDIHRVELKGNKRIMDVPEFKAVQRVKEFAHGPADKPCR